MTTILKLENLNYGYEDGGYKRQILKDLSYEFEQGQFYTILGPSGSGKTTLLSIIAGLDKQENGKIYYEGEDLDKIGLYKYQLSDRIGKHRTGDDGNGQFHTEESEGSRLCAAGEIRDCEIQGGSVGDEAVGW